MGQAGDGQEAARVAAEVSPDVVVMDVVVPSQSPFATPSTASSTSRGVEPMQGLVLWAVQSGLLDDQGWDHGSHEHLAGSDMANAPTVQGIWYLFAASWGRDDAGTLAGRGAAPCARATLQASSRWSGRPAEDA